MIDVRKGGPGEVEIEIEAEDGMIQLDAQCEVVGPKQGVVIWMDTSRALDLAEKLKDIVQAMDEAEREREP
jgi:hypothetical protein